MFLMINDSTTLADIALVKHSNNQDWWIVVKKFIRGSYDKFLLSNGNFQLVNQQEIGDTTNHYPRWRRRDADFFAGWFKIDPIPSIR
jgi:hypothetical protein